SHGRRASRQARRDSRRHRYPAGSTKRHGRCPGGPDQACATARAAEDQDGHWHAGGHRLGFGDLAGRTGWDLWRDYQAAALAGAARHCRHYARDLAALDGASLAQAAETEPRPDSRCQRLGGECQGQNERAVWWFAHGRGRATTRLPAGHGRSVCGKEAPLGSLYHPYHHRCSGHLLVPGQAGWSIARSRQKHICPGHICPRLCAAAARRIPRKTGRSNEVIATRLAHVSHPPRGAPAERAIGRSLEWGWRGTVGCGSQVYLIDHPTAAVLRRNAPALERLTGAPPNSVFVLARGRV